MKRNPLIFIAEFLTIAAFFAGCFALLALAPELNQTIIELKGGN
jgi:hypothetical protein